MSYHPLNEDTGHVTMQDRVEEVMRLVAMLVPYRSEMTIKEEHFLIDMSTAHTCTPNQLFWLRDMKDKYL